MARAFRSTFFTRHLEAVYAKLNPLLWSFARSGRREPTPNLD